MKQIVRHTKLKLTSFCDFNLLNTFIQPFHPQLRFIIVNYNTNLCFSEVPVSVGRPYLDHSERPLCQGLPDDSFIDILKCKPVSLKLLLIRIIWEGESQSIAIFISQYKIQVEKNLSIDTESDLFHSHQRLGLTIHKEGLVQLSMP
jgi:hypothetical protein